MNIVQAHAAINRVYRDAWVAAAPVGSLTLYEEVPLTPAQQAIISGTTTPIVSWARLTIKDNLDRQTTIASAPDSRRFDAQGVLIVEVYTPSGMGGLAGMCGTLCMAVQNAFRGPNISDPWYRNVSINPVGRDGFWFHANVVAEFQYADRR